MRKSGDSCADRGVLFVKRHVTLDGSFLCRQNRGMLDARKINSRKLRRLVERGDESGIRPDWLPKTKRILAMLHAAASPEELNLPGYGWHKLKGDRSDTYSVVVSKNWRITFKWDRDGPYDIDLEDYHGS